jgi:hypothetical protein
MIGHHHDRSHKACSAKKWPNGSPGACGEDGEIRVRGQRGILRDIKPATDDCDFFGGGKCKAERITSFRSLQGDTSPHTQSALDIEIPGSEIVRETCMARAALCEISSPACGFQGLGGVNAKESESPLFGGLPVDAGLARTLQWSSAGLNKR